MCSVIVAFIAKLQIPSSKLQRISKNQISKTQPRARNTLELDAWCFSGAWMLELGCFSSVTFPHHEIERPQNCRNITHHVPRQQMRQNAQVHERWRAYLHPIRRPAALAVDVKTQLTLRIFRGEINLARRRIHT